MKPIYISYSNTDRDFAQQLTNDFDKASINVWIDFLKLKPGQDWQEAMREGMNEAGALLICLSPRSIPSRWVRREIVMAREQGKFIIPVMIEPCWEELKVYEETSGLLDIFILTFYNKPYDQALQELVQTIQELLLTGKPSPEPVKTSAQKTLRSPTISSVRIFISSPGDLFPEREIVKEVIKELNNSPYYIDRFKLIPYAYEDTVPAVAGEEAQRVVNKYLIMPDTVDIFLCMFWLRMGTPTDGIINSKTRQPYQSGTEYEFLAAYDSSQQRNAPIILLYQCNRIPKDISKLDTQHERVKAFFARFEAGGDLKGYFNKFRSKVDLKEIIRRDLQMVLERDF